MESRLDMSMMFAMHDALRRELVQVARTAALRDDNPGQLSAGCQFYIVANKKGLPKLDNHYTVYGQVFKGMDVVESIVSVPKDSTNKPYTPITLHIDVIGMSADGLKADGYVPK